MNEKYHESFSFLSLAFETSPPPYLLKKYLKKYLLELMLSSSVFIFDSHCCFPDDGDDRVLEFVTLHITIHITSDRNDESN